MKRINIVAMIGGLMAALLVVLLVLPGCTALGPLVGKPDKVVIYHFGDLSGPYAPATASILNGFQDFAEWYNEDIGGIAGVPIVDKYIDTKGEINAALEAYGNFKASSPYPIIMILYGSAESERLRNDFIEDGILCFTNSPRGVYPTGYEFSTIPTYADSIGAFIDWVTEDWAKRTGEKVRLAILTWNTQYGNAVRTDAVREYAATKGVEIVYEGTFKTEDSDVSVQMSKIKDATANWIYDNTLGHGPKVISSAAASMGILNHDLYDNTPGKIHRATGPWGMDNSMIMLAGELAEGMVGPRSIASWSMSEVEGVAKAIAAFDKHNRNPEERVIGYLGAWPVMYTVCHCMNKAVEDTGWDKLNGTTLKEQFIKLRDFKPMGMTVYTFTADRPAPTQTVIFKVEKGRLLPITDWITCPDLRPAALR
jgi:branched-chain amino acid transport system substrate-binding protein